MMVFSSGRKRPLAHAKDNNQHHFLAYLPTSFLLFRKKDKNEILAIRHIEKWLPQPHKYVWNTIHSYRNYAKQFNDIISALFLLSEIEKEVKLFPPTSVQFFIYKFVIINVFPLLTKQFQRNWREKKLWSRLYQTQVDWKWSFHTLHVQTLKRNDVLLRFDNSFDKLIHCEEKKKTMGKRNREQHMLESHENSQYMIAGEKFKQNWITSQAKR